MRRVGEIQTKFQKVVVWKSALATEFRVTGAIHASFHRKRFLTGLAWDIIAAAALLRPGGPPKSVLMLGVAGGTALRTLRHLLPDAELTGIDLDKELISLARQEMELDGTGARIVLADAYHWLEWNQETFDVVIDDLYLAGEHDVEREESEESGIREDLLRAVAPGGLLVMNLVIGAGHRAVQSRSRREMIKAFPVVRSVSTCDSLNEVLVAGGGVETGGALGNYLPHFTDWRDRMFWKRIKVRKLS